jgi:hypothetical protein
VVNDRGRYGLVLDWTTGKQQLSLDRYRAYYQVTRFPIAFFEYQGDTLLIHATGNNRLDIFNLEKSIQLTERDLPVWKRGEKCPEHYLDYSHCGLSVSPDQEWIVDWGWVWHPYGVIAFWDLHRWVAENIWESEDGDSKREFCYRDYYWNGPTCWIDDRTIAVWGRGKRDECLIPAVCLYNVETGEELRWFIGPPKGKLDFDRHLFSYGEEGGMSVWDADTGERLLHEPDFRPTVYHPGTKQFLTLLPDGRFQLSRLVGSGS